MRILKEGTRLADRYVLLRRLGAGGMSDVWLASDRRAESRVALKFLSPALAANPAYSDLFHKEWQTGIRLMHAHIARVFEFHDDPDGPFYSQQYIGGPDAGALSGLPVHEALRPFGLIADALRYAHGKSIVHRDIKASNILFDARGAPYLVDFGVAAATGTDHGASGGTAVAMSPQQKTGESPAPADDIYALGVLLHETVFGRPPGSPAPDGPDSDSSVTVPAAHDGAPLPEGLQSLLEDMLAADGDRRPSAEAVGRRLGEAGIAAGPASLRTAALVADSDDVAIESVQSVRPFRRSTAKPADSGADRGGRGVSPAFLFGGLAALALVFVSVFYLLPNGNDTDQAGDIEPAVDQQSGVPADDNASGDAASNAEDQMSPSELQSIKAATDEALGDLLSDLERLRLRAVERWGGQAFQHAVDVYKSGDEAYLAEDYELAGARYREAIELLAPFFGRIDDVFTQTMKTGKAAFAEGNHADAVRLFGLAVAITPGDVQAEEWLARARNLESVLTLTDQGLRFESNLELQAAKVAFEKALALDPEWKPAAGALERVVAAIRQRSFERRMTEGLNALAEGNFASARAAFNAAKDLMPESQQPVDGLLQVDQQVRLASIRRMEQEAIALEEGEQWQAAVATYKKILEIDPLLQFAKEGLARASQRLALHRRLDSYIARPDSLSAPATMQAATNLLLHITRMPSIGPRLEDQKNELSRLLKRAATPLTVKFVSDNATEVSIFRVGQLGKFSTEELQLRPGSYVAVGSRVGYRDVRLEFRVAPELEQEPIVIKCEERI